MLELTKDEARLLMVEYLAAMFTEEDEVSIADAHTEDTSFGWVFYYNTTEFLTTGDDMACLVGNAPVLIDKTTGKLHVAGTGREIGHYIAMYKKHGSCHPD